jgi:2-phospho-L-lactate transferase/gluconeogenesis factor (CofD/UPF0052 family)
MDLTLIVNCYDDGKSTGAIRRVLPGMLGPSDVRKNVARYGHAPLLEKRVDSIRAAFGMADLEQAYSLQAWERHIKDNHIPFAYHDCAFGNLLFAGRYLTSHCDFNAVSTWMTEKFSSAAKILNVTNGVGLWARFVRNDGSECSEGAICEKRGRPIKSIYFSAHDGGKGRPCEPALNPLVAEAIGDADLIVYGPGTQYSSLYPSYLTPGIYQLLLQQFNTPKIYVHNLSIDNDTPINADVPFMLAEFAKYMRGGYDRLCSAALNEADKLETLYNTITAMVLPQDVSGGGDTCGVVSLPKQRGNIHDGAAAVDAVLEAAKLLRVTA